MVAQDPSDDTGDDFPTAAQIQAFIDGSETRMGKRDIIRAFGIKSADRGRLNVLLRKMRNSDSRLPPVAVLDVLAPDQNGDLLARPPDWPEDPPKIYVKSGGHRGKNRIPAPVANDRILARLSRNKDGTYLARVMKIITSGPRKVMGIYTPGQGEARVLPTDRKSRLGEIVVEPTPSADKGALVVAELVKGRHFGLRKGKITEVLGNINDPRAVSLISLHTHAIPTEFSPEAARQADEAVPAGPDPGRIDLRDIPLVTIDGEDARDYDDAVWAEPDSDPDNPGGWHVMVAIADVSWYVPPDSPLDKEALERGNSVYFPDRVVPMLPPNLSNGLCSLVPQEDRGCLAVEIRIDAGGRKRRHKFCRGLMRSAARLTYHQVQAVRDGDLDQPGVEKLIAPLYGAFNAFMTARRRRGVLDLTVPERRVRVDDSGTVTGVKLREHLDAHRLIEEFMIAANVCAAEELERLHQPCMYRIHDQPADDKIDALREFLTGMGYAFPRGQVMKPGNFNQILSTAKGRPEQDLVHTLVLRAQSQAVYSPDNIGHFGLSLPRYAHFTSPIRRYSDVLVHRALVTGLNLGQGGLPQHRGEAFGAIGQTISNTERRAALAERDAVDRYVAAFMADKIGREYAGRITGVQRFGLFITLDATGADGLLPVAALPDDYYRHDRLHHTLIGQNSRETFRLGDRLTVKIAVCDRVTGALELQLAEDRSTSPQRPAPPKKSRRRAGATSGRPKPTAHRRRS